MDYYLVAVINLPTKATPSNSPHENAALGIVTGDSTRQAASTTLEGVTDVDTRLEFSAWAHTMRAVQTVGTSNTSK